MQVIKVTIDHADDTLFFYLEDGRVTPWAIPLAVGEYYRAYAEGIRLDIEEGFKFLALSTEDAEYLDTSDHEIIYQITLH